MESEFETHFRRGLSCYHAAEFETAVSEFSKSIECDPSSAEAYLRRALAAEECGHLAEVRADLEMILRLDPGSGVRFFARAMLLSQSNFLQAGQDPDSFYLETIQLYSRAIDQAPCLAPAYFFRGEMKWEIGDVHGALADYDRAIKLDSLYARAYVRRARAKARLGDLPAAMDDLEFFLTLPMGKTRNSNVLKNISAYGLQLSRNRPPSAQGEWRQSDL